MNSSRKHTRSFLARSAVWLAAATFGFASSTESVVAQATAAPVETDAQPTADTQPRAAKSAPHAVAANAETAAKPTRKRLDHSRFLRIRKDDRRRSLALQTSIVRYEGTNTQGKKVTVDLIGAVHIGEAEYFEELNRQFTTYEALLYELVAPKDTVIPKGGRASEDAGVPTNPVAALQMGMQTALELEFQLNLIDYTPDNFVHADMSPEEYSQSMKENDESIAGYALKGIGQGLALQSAGKSGGDIGMLMSIFSSDRAASLRRTMAKQMLDMGGGMIMFEGKNGSTIIDHRNAKCMSVLKEQIDSGKTNLGIFYGAGHLADMEQRLLNEFNLKRGESRWLDAWKLR